MKTKVLLLLGGCFSASLHAAVIVLGADKDATIFQSGVNNSSGAGAGIFAGTSGTSSPRRGLISFDLSSIPAGSVITDVQFTLTLGQIVGPASTATRTFRLYELLRSWGEGTTYETTVGIGTTGQGLPAGNGDATWNAAHYSATTPTLWTTPGGDFDPTASSMLTVPVGAVVSDAFTWPSTANLIADAQGWLDQPATNFGWLLRNNEEASPSTAFAFYSSEWSDASAGDPAQEPKLQITYVPEPASGALWALGTLALFARRRFRRKPTARA